MLLREGLAAEVSQRGFVVMPHVVDRADVSGYLAALPSALDAPGIRNLFDAVPATASFVASVQLGQLASRVLGGTAKIVRAILFDKNRTTSWRVPWHQDLFVAAAARADAAGFTAWTTKSGVPHARAPREVLERMLTVRIHLDECGPANGPLRVLPATHTAGVFNAGQIARYAAAVDPVTCFVPAGGAVLMRPLLLHASSDSRSPSHRRVLHLELSATPLPAPLRWHEWRHFDGGIA